MPRKISYVPTAANGSGATLPLSAIPQDVIDEVEEVYAALKANPDGRMRAEFDTKEELNQFMTQVISYCAHRKVQDVATPLRFRKSPTKGLPETVMDFRIGDPLPAKEETPATADTATATPATTTQTPAATPEAAALVKAAGRKK